LFKAIDVFGWTEGLLGPPAMARTADFGASARNLWVGQLSAAGNFDAIRISDAAGSAGLREVLTGLTAPTGGTVIFLR
jgi:hypothetical protein